MKKEKIIVIDNYDSFTYNLVHIIGELGYSSDVFRNDKISIQDIAYYDKILLSPGPGLPADAGIMTQIIQLYGPQKSILGVCLGHQGIAEIYGAKLYNLSNVLHGVRSKVQVLKKTDRLFKNIPEHFDVGHYHSWAVDWDSVQEKIEITAVNENGIVMAIAHRQFDVHGVQFHPESILTEFGKDIIKNWLDTE